MLIYKNHYVLIKKLHIFLWNHNCNYVCRCCLNSYTGQNVLIKHKQQCGEQDITPLRLSNESHIYWKNHFHKHPLYFSIYADFEAGNEIDNSNVGNKTTNIYKQNPKLNGYRVESELDNVLSDYYKSPLGYNIVDWCEEEVMNSESKMAFKNTKEDIIMTEDEDFKNNDICRFCEKILSDKVRGHCHLPAKYRGAAHSICNFKVTQKQSKFIPFMFHNFSNYDCHVF